MLSKYTCNIVRVFVHPQIREDLLGPGFSPILLYSKLVRTSLKREESWLGINKNSCITVT